MVPEKAAGPEGAGKPGQTGERVQTVHPERAGDLWPAACPGPGADVQVLPVAAPDRGDCRGETAVELGGL